MAPTRWILEETARRFLVSAQTIANWRKRLVRERVSGTEPGSKPVRTGS
ncbi:MAG: hypothetical protein H6718_15000 [Polyangiaceae bacterium]|nr:hypothetical protein [Polyangiaceae bacterium]MCB9606213.1 hypothetical protein [Polyangiaceae bacterium]